MANPVFRIRNFGPVQKGEFELRPFTVFLGKNNTGKTYVALLVHAILQAILGRITEIMPSMQDEIFRGGKAQKALAKDWRTFRELLTSQSSFRYSDFPESIKIFFSDYWTAATDNLPKSIEIAMRNYFQYSQPNELICKSQHKSKSMSVNIKHVNIDSSKIGISLSPRSKSIHASVNIPNISTLETMPYPKIFKKRIIPFYIGLAYLPAYIFRNTCLGVDISRVYYLPAFRSGILQVWPLIGTYIIDSLKERAVGLHPGDIRRTPGVTFDFMDMLYKFFSSDFFTYRSPRNIPDFNKIARFMEADILGGQIEIPKSKEIQNPSFTYRSADLSIDVQRASSMIAELTPLDLLIKRSFEEDGDLLIIDEPEAHLHPESQRKLALLLARLVRNGVKVICTTHSHIFLHQISNLVLASTTSLKTRKRLDLEESFLNATDVGVYHFDTKDGSTSIKEVVLIEDFGYPEDDYVKVYEELLQENSDLAD